MGLDFLFITIAVATLTHTLLFCIFLCGHLIVKRLKVNKTFFISHTYRYTHKCRSIKLTKSTLIKILNKWIIDLLKSNVIQKFIFCVL